MGMFKRRESLESQMEWLQELRREHPEAATHMMKAGVRLGELAKAGDDMGAFVRLAMTAKDGLLLYWHIVRAFTGACVHGRSVFEAVGERGEGRQG